ncbi:MAG: hypothetical protein XXXNARYT_003147 [Candidatus Accumulibacter regalis]|jgi:hypothetical protein|uniref:hypothetical protein n=1 Tax=unclassified Candidatus Accumulibacter TaxID=2619054 RepID=UPI001B10BCE9|nr:MULTISPECIES: hypothetical protein [unclassified Candidatus Accumulibacter]MBO3703168.1 hypothetical protein [Accumulibacter sp.]
MAKTVLQGTLRNNAEPLSLNSRQHRNLAMNMGYRFFVVDEDNSIIQISQRSFNDFYLRQKPSLQRFAGCAINVATVIYTLENRKPKQILRIDYVRMRVDNDGALDQEQILDSFRLVANRMGKVLGDEQPVNNSGQVVNAIGKFDQRRWSQLHPQLPGPAHKRILRILFGSKNAV